MMSDVMTDRRLPQTPWQTVGPFFHYALPWEGGETLIGSNPAGEKILIRGQVLDGEGNPIPDALIEIWQANSAGRYAHPDDTQTGKVADARFVGFGRCPTDADGMFSFYTIRPGAVPGPGNSQQAPHIAIGVFGRGLLRRLVTRLYFPESESNANDPILAYVEPERVETLIAVREADRTDIASYKFDIRLQGDRETVFFNV